MRNLEKGASFLKPALTWLFSKEKIEVTRDPAQFRWWDMREFENQKFLVGRGESLRGRENRGQEWIIE